MERVVITGMGLSTALGPDLPTCWAGLVGGRSGIAPISRWDVTEYTTKVAAEAAFISREDPADSVPWQWCRRSVRMFNSVAAEAWRDAALDQAPLSPSEVGVGAGASMNWIDIIQLRRYAGCPKEDGKVFDLLRYAEAEEHPLRGYYKRMGDMMVAVPARALGARGPSFVMDTACAASAHSIGEAYRLVQRGKASAMIAGGSTALVNPIAILAFALLGALSRNANPDDASRPFDKSRDGFVMGEGAGAVILESLSSARARGARIYAELAGFGSTLNAYTLTDPSPDGSAEARAMSLAVAEAGLQREDISYVAAHGTSTPKNDASETLAIKQFFGSHASKLMVSSNKGAIGHTISAAGVCNVICTVKTMTEGVVAPTIHLKNADPACDLDYVANESRPAVVRAAIANAFAFGGQNAVLALKAWNN